MMYLSETEAIFLPLSLVKISLSWKTHSSKLYYDNTVELVQSDFPTLWHPTKIMVPKVFLFTKIKLEYSNILYNLTHFHGDFDTFPWSLWHISLVPLTQFPGPFDTFPWSLCVSDRFHCLLLVTLFCNTQKICSNARHCWKISEKNTFWLAQDNSFVLTSIRGLFSSIVIEVIF
jgi:hypothetical protein